MALFFKFSLTPFHNNLNFMQFSSNLPHIFLKTHQISLNFPHIFPEFSPRFHQLFFFKNCRIISSKNLRNLKSYQSFNANFQTALSLKLTFNCLQIFSTFQKCIHFTFCSMCKLWPCLKCGTFLTNYNTLKVAKGLL